MHKMEKLQQGNYASTSNQGDEQLFVMQHMANSMIGGVSDNNVWYVNSMLFTHGKGAGDIRIWHKQVGHVNL